MSEEQIPLYRDPIKAAKLQEAIRLGFIENFVTEDGNQGYRLTGSGQAQWVKEMFFARFRPSR